MQRIAITQAKAGMVLADAAENEKGTVVCGPGTPLTEILIGRLERFGVGRISVEGHPVKKAGEDKSLETLAAELDARFAKHTDNPLMMEVKGVFHAQLQERMAEFSGETGEADAGEADA